MHPLERLIVDEAMKQAPARGPGSCDCHSAPRALSLRLVTQALLVAVGFHPLLALMFAGLGLTTFFEGTHGLGFLRSVFGGRK